MWSLVNPRLRRFYRVLVAAAVSAAVLVPGPAAAQGSSGGSSDASLSGLEVTGFSGEDQPMPVVGLWPAFDSSVLGYGASAAFTPRVRVRATAAAAGASVEVDGQSVASGGFSQVFYLGNGTNATKRVVVRVTAPDGATVRSYSVVVVNNPAAGLGDLELSGAQIRPSVFSNALKEYRAWVPHSVESVRVTATAQHASVVLAVNGKAAVSGQASDPLPLEAGSNLITVTATAPDGFTRSTYTVTVRRATAEQSADASLSGISVWLATSKQPDSANNVPYEGEAFALSPTVSGSVREHWVEVPEAAGRYLYLAVAADTSAPGAKRIVVSGTRSIEEARAPKRDVVSGEASGPWYAPVGHSLITVDVTSLDGTSTESYRLIVKRGTVDDPEGVSVTPGDGSLRVGWEQSDSPTAPDNYTLRWRKTGETQWLNPAPLAEIGIKRSLAKDAPVVTAEDGNGILPADRGGETITGLDNGTAYDVQVRGLRITIGFYRNQPLRWLASDWQSLTATPGKPRTALSITPDHPTRVYGTADDLSYTVSGLADGDAAGDVVTGALSRTAGDDAGSYPISMGTLAVASGYADEYELPAAPTVAAYEIEPRPIPAVSGVLVATRDYDGTTAAAFDTTNAAGVDVLPAELADFRAGGLAVAGSFPTAEAGTHNIAATYTLADHGAFKAANYELLQTAATLQGRIDAVEAQPACTPAVGGDYDRDDDRLIEICDFEQLNAIRFDPDGDAQPLRGTAYEYLRAFPRIIADGPGCPGGCKGYELVTDLDFDTNGNGRADQGDQFWNDGTGWEPMPILNHAYNAVFEGNGHTIANLHMNKPANMSKVGLFGSAGAGAQIRNITLSSVEVSGGHDMVGGLAGASWGHITDSHVSGTLRSDHDIGLLVGENHGRVADSSASGTVAGDRDVGILVGENYSLITGAGASGHAEGRYAVGGLVGKQMNGARLHHSSAVATVNGTTPVDRQGRDVGGLVGSNSGKIRSSAARAVVTGQANRVGGLVGINTGTGAVYAAYAFGKAQSSGEHVGGLVGVNQGFVTASYSTVAVAGGGLVGTTVGGGRVANSYWDKHTSGTTTSAAGTGHTTAALQSPAGYFGIYAGWNVDGDGDGRPDKPWQFSGAGYPLLRQLASTAEMIPTASILLTADADPSEDDDGDLVLESIRVSEPLAVDPAFDPDTRSYTITLPPQMPSVKLHGGFADPSAGGHAYLAAAADLADFEALGVGTANEHLLAQLAGSAAGTQEVSLDNGESQTIEVGIYKWKPGEENQAPFAEHTHKQAYTLTIRRAHYPVDDAGLNYLGISPGTLAFDPDTRSYRVDVASTTSTVTVTALTSHPRATVTVNGEHPDTPVALNGYGTTAVAVVVTAVDGTTTRTYRIAVDRARDTKIRFTAVVDVTTEATDDMQITGLTLPPGFTIEPAFSPDHYQYTVTAPLEWDRVEVKGRYTTPWSRDGGWNSTAYIFAGSSLEQSLENYQKRRDGDASMVATSKWTNGNTVYLFREMVDVLHNDFVHSVRYDLAPGEPTDIALVLYKWKQGKGGRSPVKDNSVAKAYTLTVTRALPADTEAGLHRLGTSAGPVALVDGQTDYTLKAGPTVAALTVTPTPLHPSAVVTVNGGPADTPVALDYGANAVSVVVTAADGTTTKTYTLTVTRSLPAAPAAPAAVEIEVGLGNATVSWEAPSARTGVPLDFYEVRVRDSQGQAVATRKLSVADLNGDLSADFSGLSNGADYTFGVRAGNAGGAGAWLEIGVTMPTPTELSGLTIAAGPNNGGRALAADALVYVRGTESYDVTVPAGMAQVVLTPTVFDPKTVVTISGSRRLDQPISLEYGENPISVAVSAAGETPRTYAVTVTRQSPPKPGTPVWQVDAYDTSTVVVRWRDSSDAAAADSWDLELVDGDGTKTTVCICLTAKNDFVYNRSPSGEVHYSHWFEGLAAGETYTVRIRGVNDGGASEWATARVTLSLMAELEGLRLEAITRTTTGNEVQLAQSLAKRRTSYTISLPEGVVGLRVLPEVTQPKTATINGKNSSVRANTYVTLQRGKTTDIRITVTEGVHTRTYTIAATVGGTTNDPTVACAPGDISGANADPTVAISLRDVALKPGQDYNLVLSRVFADSDGDTLTITAESSAPSVAAVTGVNSFPSMSVRAVAEGTATITVTADDGNCGTVSETFTVTVDAANKAPAVASSLGDVSGLEPGDTRQVPLSGVFSDADGDSLTVTARSSAASVATVSVASGYGSLTVRAVAEGAATITVTAADGNGGTVSDTFTVTVDAANKAPTVASSLGDVSSLEPGDTRQVSLSGAFNDADGDPLTITAGTSAASVATVSVASGNGSLTVRAVAEGTATITVTADDGNGGTVSDTFTVTVDASSTVPTVASPISDVSGLKPGDTRQVSLSGVFRDADGDPLAVTARSSDDSVATMSVKSDYTTMTVRAAGEGAATITVTASDGRNTVSDAFTVTVEASDTESQTEPETQQPDAPAELKDAVEHYDANGDGKIDMPEYRTALADYLGGSLSIGDLMKVRLAYVRDA